MKDTGIELDLSRHNKDGKCLLDRDGWIDVGCDSLSRAEANREMTQYGLNADAYRKIEQADRAEVEAWLQQRNEGRILR